MKKLKHKIGWKILLAGFALSALPLAVTSQESAGQAHEIKVTAQKYEFQPAEIHVKKGEKVRLLLTSSDRDHGIQIKEFNIKEKIKSGETATVEFTPDKAGTFPFECSVFCGIGHKKMKGTLVVEE